MIIYKYQLKLSTDSYYFSLPKNAKPLHVGCQGSDIFLWCLVDLREKMEKRNVLVVGTGWAGDEIRHDWYVGTCTDGHFVWHVFVEPKE